MKDCSWYYRWVESMREAELDRAYERGYTKVPESSAIGEVSVALASSVWEPEDWS